MEEKMVNILNEMMEYLSIAQMKKLQEVLLKNLSESEAQKAEISNADYLQMFLDAKKIEGLINIKMMQQKAGIDMIRILG